MSVTENFLLEDLLNVLIQLEETGQKHYLRMANMATTPKVKDLFELLSKQEGKHKVIYEGYKTAFTNQTLNDVTDEYKAYVKVTLENTIKFLEAHKSIDHIEEGLKTAINLEKDTLLFLNEMKKILGRKKEEEIERLMDEERGHLAFLYNYKE